jgi:alkanesulfonate monooxygenase SsuD/methylene tetrahydromethanopterin reductase-like flavin-dependent oxidoreductase (luciferase family)
MGVLDAHCEDVGRDPAEITRTRLGTLAIARTHEEAEQQLAAWPDRLKIDPERLQHVLTVGDPDEVGERIQALVDAGIEGFVFNMPNPHDPHALALAGETVSRALAD